MASSRWFVSRWCNWYFWWYQDVINAPNLIQVAVDSFFAVKQNYYHFTNLKVSFLNWPLFSMAKLFWVFRFPVKVRAKWNKNPVTDKKKMFSFWNGFESTLKQNKTNQSKVRMRSKMTKIYLARANFIQKIFLTFKRTS